MVNRPIRVWVPKGWLRLGKASSIVRGLWLVGKGQKLSLGALNCSSAPNSYEASSYSHLSYSSYSWMVLFSEVKWK